MLCPKCRRITPDDSNFCGWCGLPMNAKSRISTGNRMRINQLLEDGYDLVRFTTHFPTCAECSKYQGRVFSINGKDKRFPQLPDHIRRFGAIHDGCKHVIVPYIASMQTDSDLVSDIAFSNRPFKDDRSLEERELWDRQMEDQRVARLDRENYQALLNAFGKDAPKSFSAYRRMKNAKTANYIKLMQKAHNAGVSIKD